MSRPTTDIDLLAPEMQHDPVAVLAQLRERSPVAWSERHRGWLLTRFDDVAFAFRDARLSADRITPTFGRLSEEIRREVELAERHLTRWLVFMDPPGHDRLRRLVSRAFTPPRMEALRDLVRSIVAELLDSWVDGDEVDVLRTLAHPLPTAVVASLLGVPRDDYTRVGRWSGDVAAVVFGTGGDPSRFERARRGLADFDAYIRENVEAIRSGAGRPGLIADLVALHDEGDRLTEDELVATCTLLLFAGDETTTTLIVNALAVLDDPTNAEERRRLTIDVDALAQPAVEELLRFAGPTKAMVRYTIDDVALPSGTVIPEGERVYPLVIAANRDPARFPDPDRFVVDRRDNAHVGFGSGIHHCLGAPLARIEMQEVLRGLFTRFPEYAVASDVRWGGGLLGRAAGAIRVRPAPRGAGGHG